MYFEFLCFARFLGNTFLPLGGGFDAYVRERIVILVHCKKNCPKDLEASV